MSDKIKKKMENLEKEIKTLKKENEELKNKDKDLNEELKKSQEDASKYKEAAISIKSDFEHYKEIVIREKKEIEQKSKEKTLKNFIVPFQKLALSMNYKDSPEFLKAVDMVFKDFLKSFENSDLKFINPKKGEPFDPFEHEVVEKIETDEIQEYHIFNSQIYGYKIKDKVVEPAKVSVAVKPKKEEINIEQKHFVEEKEEGNEQIKTEEKMEGEE
jgi:molecular chaperone GrpE